MVIRATLLVVAVRLGLWLLPFRTLCSLLDRWAWAGRGGRPRSGQRVAGHESDDAGPDTLSVQSPDPLPTPWAPAATRDPDAALVGRVARTVERISRYVPAASCLTQALAAQALLRRCGVPVLLRIGVVKAGPRRLMAHAWVEVGDRVILGATEPGLFTPLPLLKQDIG